MSTNFYGNDYPNFFEFGDPPCSTSNPDAFFTEEPLDGAMVRRGVYAFENEAKRVCAECPYKQRCLEYALRHPDLQGIWGGTNEHQRKAIRKGIPISLNIPTTRAR